MANLSLQIDSKQFDKDMDSLISYSLGFFEGVKEGQPAFLRSFGGSVLESLKSYIDSNARVNPELLHHVYEWSETGSPAARLFDLSYTTSGSRISFMSSFRQSSSVKSGSTVPFYDKARIMEYGVPITITPTKKVLAFEEDGQTVFTSKPVFVPNPGGNVSGEYEKAFKSFFTNYFTQAFLQSSGILSYLKSPTDFYKNLSVRGGRSKGIATGKAWISKAGNL
jgi:hypothetical protein